MNVANFMGSFVLLSGWAYGTWRRPNGASHIHLAVLEKLQDHGPTSRRILQSAVSLESRP